MLKLFHPWQKDVDSDLLKYAASDDIFKWRQTIKYLIPRYSTNIIFIHTPRIFKKSISLNFVHNLQLQKKKIHGIKAFLDFATKYCGEVEVFLQQVFKTGYMTESYLQIKGPSTTMTCFFTQQKAIYHI